MKGLSWTNFVLGLWLAVAPFILVYQGVSVALWEDIIVGILIAGFALWRALGPETQGMAAVSWIVAALGLWALIAPFALGYSNTAAALWNDMIVGIAVAALAFYRNTQGPVQVPCVKT